MPDNQDQAISELANEWMQRARNDLALAQLTDEKRIAPDILVFHAQQAAEKAIKALLVRYQVEFPFTHSIGALLSVCQSNNIEVPENITNSHALTRYAVASRYPGEAEPTSRSEAYEAAQLATMVVNWVEGLLAGKS